jgi:hypothetical protein
MRHVEEDAKPQAAIRQFARFAKTWVKRALGGVWGRIGDAATVLGLVVPAVSGANPGWWKRVIAVLHVSGNESLLWEAPVVVGGSILVVRLVLAPFWILRAERKDAARVRGELESAAKAEQAHFASEAASQRRAAEESIEQLQRRVAELETPAPRVMLWWAKDSKCPIALKNVGPVEAHRVKVGDFEVGKEYVEFGEVDPLENDGQPKYPEFSCQNRDEKYGPPLKATMFSWFLNHVAEAETYAVWR